MALFNGGSLFKTKPKSLAQSVGAYPSTTSALPSDPWGDIYPAPSPTPSPTPAPGALPTDPWGDIYHPTPTPVEPTPAPAPIPIQPTPIPIGPAPSPEGLKPLHDVKWKAGDFNLEAGKAPAWWKGLVPEDVADAERADVQTLMMLNTLIPYMSPEDQRRAASQLYAANADAFSAYKPENLEIAVPYDPNTRFLPGGENLPTIDRDYYLSSERARGAINVLNQMREQTVGGNRWKLGPGYTWMQQVLGALEQFGGGESRYKYDPTQQPTPGPVGLDRPAVLTPEQEEYWAKYDRGEEPGPGSFDRSGPMTRTDMLAMMGALDPLMAQGQSAELGSFGAIGQMLSQPFFSQGQLIPSYQQGGTTRFGAPNPLLFR